MKKQTIKLLLIITLLIVEALVSIRFSECTADIINIGLVKKGIDSSIPFFIDANYIELIKKYLDNNSIVDLYYEEYSKEKQPYLLGEEIKDNVRIYIIKNNIDTKRASEDLANLIKPLIAAQNKRVKLKVKDMVRSRLSTKEYNDVLKAAMFRDFGTVEKKLPDDLKDEIISYLREESYEVNDSIIEPAVYQINEYMIENIGIDAKNIQKRYIINEIKYLLLLTFIELLSQYFSISLCVEVAGEYSAKLKSKLTRKILKSSNNEIQKIGKTNLIAILLNNTKKIETILPIIIKEAVYSPIIIIYGCYLIKRCTNLKIIILLLLTVLLLIGVSFIMFGNVAPKLKNNKVTEGKINTRIKGLFYRSYSCTFIFKRKI